MTQKLKQQENTIMMHIQTTKNVETLKEQLVQKLEENEQLTERVGSLEKDNAKMRSELKDAKVFTQCLQDEQKTIKENLKEKEHELKLIKSDCAATLISKEKTLQQKVLNLENTLSDLQFENQKYVQKVHDMKEKFDEDLERVRQETNDQLQAKDKQLKQLKTQRECMFKEISQLKGIRSEHNLENE